MGRGLGVNKPCIKCAREVPAAFKSPIPGFCGRCTDEVLRTLGVGAGRKPGVELIEVPAGRRALAWGGGALVGALLLLLFAAFAPDAFDGLRNGLRGLFGLG